MDKLNKIIEKEIQNSKENQSKNLLNSQIKESKHDDIQYDKYLSYMNNIKINMIDKIENPPILTTS